MYPPTTTPNRELRMISNIIENLGFMKLYTQSKDDESARIVFFIHIHFLFIYYAHLIITIPLTYDNYFGDICMLLTYNNDWQ